MAAPGASPWRRGVAALAALVLLAALAPAGAVAADAAPTPLRSGCEYDYPPYCIGHKDGTAEGFSVDLLRAALAVMGRTATFKTGPWNELKQDLEHGRLQVLPLVGRTPEREAIYDFSVPYLTMHGAIVIRAGTTAVRTFEDLTGKRVAVLKGDNAEEFVHRVGLDATITATDTYEAALRQLADGQHDAVVIQRLVFLRLQRQHRLTTLTTVGPALKGFVQKFCFAVRKGDSELLGILNEGLAVIHGDGTFRQLHERWLAMEQDAEYHTSRLVVGGNADYPPYTFLDAAGQPSGYFVDLTRAIAQDAGLSIEFRLGPWPRIREMLAAGEIDVAEGMLYSAERSREFSFSPPKATVSHVLVHREGTPAPADLYALAGRTILVQRASLPLEQLVRLGYERQVLVAPTHQEALRRLADGEGDYALLPKLPAMAWIKQHGWQHLRTVPTPLTADSCYAALREQGPLIARFTEGMASLERSGRLQEIRRRWLSPYEDPPLGFAQVAKFAAIIIVPLLALLLGFYLWTRTLRRHVALATARYRDVFDSMVDGFATHEVLRDGVGAPCDYRFLSVNPAFERLTGLRAAAIVGRRVREVVPDLDPAWISTCCAVAESGEPAHFESTTLVKGLTFEVHVHRPAPGMFACIISDISQRKQAEQALIESRQRLALAASSAQLGIWDWDIQANRMTWDDQMYQLYGITDRPAVMGVEIWTDRLHPDDATVAREASQAALDGKAPYDVSFRICRPDGTIRHIRAHGMVLCDGGGKPQRMLGINYDVTERFQTERALIQATEEARAASVAKSLFLATMSHEIRTPLNGVIGMSDMLMQSGLNPDQADMVKVVQDCGNSLLAVISDILDLAKIESGTVELNAAPVPIRQLVAEIQGMFSVTVLTKGIRFSISVDTAVPEMVQGDATRLRQVLLNLVGNAVKFTDRGEVSLAVGVDATGARGPLVVWNIADTGPGIPAEYLPRLFTPFTQADASMSRRHGGSGLGLAIAKRLIDLMGGSIDVESEAGRGSRFRLAIPMAPVETGAAPATTPHAGTTGSAAWPRPPSILVVDDDPIGQATLQLMLDSLGCRHQVAQDGRQAIDAVAAGTFDLVLMDCQMPECDGFAATRAIRGQAQPGARRLPIVALTANVFTDDRQRCRDAGMDDFLAKPCKLETLRTCLLRWLGGGALRP